MPRFYPSVLISDAYGSVGDVTFYHRDGKCYYRKRSRCRYPGLLRNFLAEGSCAAGVVSIVIPGYVERWGYELDKYQVYARFVLIDTVTGYRSQYQDYSGIIKAGLPITTSE